MARTHTFKNAKAIASALAAPERLSRFLALQLVEMGYLTTQVARTGLRGRPSHSYAITGKGRSLLNIAKNWGRKNFYLKQYTKPVAEASGFVYAEAA